MQECFLINKTDRLYYTGNLIVRDVPEFHCSISGIPHKEKYRDEILMNEKKVKMPCGV
jgi:hypothetical protein